MKKKNLHTPEGVRDIYKMECKNKLYIQNTLHDTLKLYGFQDIQTPSFEFSEVFSDEVGTTDSKKLYQFFDREGNMLALRPDITPSIARVAATQLNTENTPHRFCYTGSAFINSSSYQGRLKEHTQLGAELIGVDSIDVDAEMIAMAVESLKSVGMTEFQVSVGHIGYIKGLLDTAKLDEQTQEEVQELMVNRNYYGVAEILTKVGLDQSIKDAFAVLPELIGGREVLEMAKSKAINEEALKAVERLERINEVLEMHGVSEYITFDFTITGMYKYYTGIVFRGYTYGIGNSVIKGGRYNQLLKQFGVHAPAIGFAIVVDDVLNALNRQNVVISCVSENQLIIYDKDMKRKAISLANRMRKEGKIAELMEMQNEGKLNQYIFYGKSNFCKNLLVLRNDKSIELINLLTDERRIINSSSKENV